MSKKRNVKQHKKGLGNVGDRNDDAIEKELNKKENHFISFHCMKMKNFINNRILIGSEHAVLVYVFLYLLDVFQTFIINIIAFSIGAEENNVFGIVCVFTDILDVVICITIFRFLVNTKLDYSSIDPFLDVLVFIFIFMIISILKLTAVFLLVNYINTCSLMTDKETKVVHWLELALLFLFSFRLVVQGLLFMNIVMLLRVVKTTKNMSSM